MKVKIKKLDPKAVIPSYAKPGDAGLDLTCVSVRETLNYIEYDTGIALEIPENHVGLIYPRSSISNTGQVLANSTGIVDCFFRGSLKLRMYRVNGHNTYSSGDRVGQLMIIPYPKVEFEEVDQLSETERGQKGFGSSGA